MQTYLRLKSVTLMLFGVAGMLYASSTVSGSPSPALEVALAARLSALPAKESVSSWDRMKQVLQQARGACPKSPIKAGFEYEGPNKPLQWLTIELPAGTLGEQLDKLSAAAGYIWQANGDWINFVPKAKATDPDYVMNLRIPGKVVLSREPDESTSVKEWFAAHRIVSTRIVKYLELKFRSGQPQTVSEAPLRPDPIVLDNPTLREYWNAHSTLYGEDVYAVQISIVPSPEGGAPHISCLTSAGNFPPVRTEAQGPDR
ncbi:MAG TPA: hypothetical protein VMX94_12915 [Armatimonadota bacterium]|nr:hypothetical protein [Armatimonadota bacterium]